MNKWTRLSRSNLISEEQKLDKISRLRRRTLKAETYDYDLKPITKKFIIMA